ncbi:PfkB family carbohydrate kinase [Frankia sp. R82]|uniref:carbohydrate kinase family protein n=1 Tax=Frankia sp. R82 TaxID=2950553 RepID=UPI0020449DD7|nr:PfkB family carbohydrate kinase [Frankia sp. R82]MCM3882404.1 PfkB family carbohydrate kinase [Frankia sp. R82]
MRTTGAGKDGAEDTSECESCADNGVGAADEGGRRSGWGEPPLPDPSGPVRPPGVAGSAGFLVAGAFVLDCLISASGLPVWGDDLRADAMRTVPGGKALNQAVTLARLGVRVAAVGSVGCDPVGEAIRSVLVADGVAVSAMPVRQGAPTPVCVVHSRPDGEKAVVWRVPDELAPTAGTLDEAARRLGGRVDATLLTFEFPSATAALVTAAARVSRWVVVHPAPAPAPTADRSALMAAVPWHLVDVLVPNEAEARALLVGHPGANGPADLLADALVDRLGVPTVCVTLGAQGCVLRTEGRGGPDRPGGRSFWHRAPTGPVVDTTAASDAFTAVFTAQLVAGRSPRAAVHAAQQAATRTVGRPGGYEALPTQAELSRLTGTRPGRPDVVSPDPTRPDPVEPHPVQPNPVGPDLRRSPAARVPAARMPNLDAVPGRTGWAARSVSSRTPV